MTKDNDNIIKNPARNISRQQTEYIPEYIRLGIKPQVVGKDGKNTDLESNVYDDKLFDDFGNEMPFDINGHMIDNNDYVDYKTFDSKSSPIEPVQVDSFNAQTASATSDNIPAIGEYILMVAGKIILTGSLSIIENKVKYILYKEDVEFSNDNLNVDDIVVLKRVDIKIGVFLGE